LARDLTHEFGLKAFPFLPERLLANHHFSTNSLEMVDDFPEKDDFSSQSEINLRRAQLKESISKLSIPAIKRNIIIQ
jgi:hypothetical protein